MGFKSIDRARKIADEMEAIDRTVAQSISALNRDLVRVQNFAAFVFNSVVQADGDADADDLAQVIAQFRAQRQLIDAFIPMLDAVQAINDETTPENIPANLAGFIDAWSIDLDNYGGRFS